MTDEHTDAGPATASPDSAEPDEDRVQVAFNEALAYASELEEHGVKVYNRWASEQMVFAFVVGNLCTAFVQALGQRAADGAVKLPKRVSDLVRTRVRRKGEPDEFHIGVDDGSAATIVVTADTPDEARLALLDLDVTAGNLRGRRLRWDAAASAWCPDDQ